MATFLKQSGVKHIRSAPCHPSTNRLAERFVQSMKQGLKASLHLRKSLSYRLYNFLFTYHSSPHATTEVTPYLFLQWELRTRFDLLQPDKNSCSFKTVSTWDWAWSTFS